MDNEKNMYNDFFDKKGNNANKNNSSTIIDQKVAHDIKFEDNLDYEENSTDRFIYIYKSKEDDIYYATKTYGHIDDNSVSINECDLVKKYKCQNSDCKYNGSYTNFIITDGDIHFTYNASYDKIIDTSGEINIYSDDNFKIGIVDSKYFYVNGQKIDFYSEIKKIRNNYPSEKEFYEYEGSKSFLPVEYDGVKTELLMSVDYNYEVIDDVLFVSVISTYNSEDKFEFFINKEGKIIKMIGNRDEDIILSGEYNLLDKVDGNEMYFTVFTDYMLQYSKDIPYCDKKDKNELDDIATITDKVTYSNGEFVVDKKIETTTYKEIGEINKIDCSNIIIK